MRTKTILLFAALLLSLNAFGQNDITKFLGIPIDGTKEAMIKNIESKGFKYDKINDVLEGEFNGVDVFISIVTIRNKVYRVCVADKYPKSEGQIKIRFNKLCAQFSNSVKYVAALGRDFSIPDSEDISYEISVNKKQYQAAFYQLPDPERMKSVWFTISRYRYDEYTIWMYYDNCYNQNTEDDI